MGYRMDRTEWKAVFDELGKTYRLFAPVRKIGEGRFTDVDVIRYDFVEDPDEIVWDERSDYSFKDSLIPLSETMFFFTEDQVKEASIDERPVIVFLRPCDLNAVKRLDQMYMDNGPDNDWFYERRRNKISFALMGCDRACENSFCVDMGANKSDEYAFSIDMEGDGFVSDVKDEKFVKAFADHAGSEQAVEPHYITESEYHVERPEDVPLSIFNDEMWDEYTRRCINCGRCNFVCPTCTCFTTQDVFYTDNGRVGERRRVNASCMVDGYTDVAGGLQFRKTNGERMRFKVLHKVYDFRKRFGYDMCVGCGRCDSVCPEYISFANCINKLNRRVEELDAEK